jgi:GT2 family glycosyltransferase
MNFLGRFRRFELGGLAQTGDAADLKSRATKSAGLQSRPQLSISIPDQGLRGALRFEIEFDEVRGPLNPVLYIPIKRGSGEQRSSSLIWVSDNRFFADFFSVHRIDCLWLNATRHSAPIKIRRMAISQISLRQFLKTTFDRLPGVRLGVWQRLQIIKFTAGAILNKGAAFARIPKPLLDRLKLNKYDAWMGSFERVNTDSALQEFSQKHDDAPKFSFILPLCAFIDGDPKNLVMTILNQIYPHWELLILGGSVMQKELVQPLLDLADGDHRVRLIIGEFSVPVSQAANLALKQATGNWIVLLDGGFVLAPHALVELAEAIRQHNEPHVVYSDEDRIDDDGHRSNPRFKCDFSLDLLRSSDYFGSLTCYHASTLRDIGGWREQFDGAHVHDLHLRMAERCQGEDIVHVPKVLCHAKFCGERPSLDEKKVNHRAKIGEAALNEHFHRLRIPARVSLIPGTLSYRAYYPLPDPLPLVSLIIPTCDQAELLEFCVESIVEKTDYSNYEIIVVDNNSKEAATFALFETLRRNKKIKLLSYKQPFNFSAINNFAVTKAKGTVLAFLNNDVEVITPGWLGEMVSHALRPEIGCVGAKLLYPNGTVQHGGVIIGLGGLAGHAHRHAPAGDPGYLGRLSVVQNFMAVTAACLVIRKETFVKAGGFDEKNLPVAYNDVDFCLRVAKLGLRNLWTPFAELYHYESISRGSDFDPDKLDRYRDECAYVQKTWPEFIEHDPYYSPNLTRTGEDFSPRI